MECALARRIPWLRSVIQVGRQLKESERPIRKTLRLTMIIMDVATRDPSLPATLLSDNGFIGKSEIFLRCIVYWPCDWEDDDALSCRA